MSLRLLELGHFSLVNSAEALKLDVVSAADIRGPRSITDLDTNALVEALASRQLWVSRGRGCRIDIEVLLDGKPLNRDDYFQLLESLGCQIRDSNPWNKLLLSTLLEILHEVPPKRVPHLSIHLNNSIKPPEHEEGLAAWIGDIDVVPPPGVLCAELERIQIQFNFGHIPERTSLEASEPPLTGSESGDVMLLDIPTVATSTQERDIQSLGQAVEALKALPRQLAGHFESPHMQSADDQLIFETPIPTGKIGRDIRDGGPPTVPCEEEDKPKKGRISKIAVSVLNTWVESHQDNLYPTADEKAKLMIDTGLSRTQLNRQLYRYRRKPMTKFASEVTAENPDEMLLDSTGGDAGSETGWDGDEMLLDHVVGQILENLEPDEPLFSQMSQDSTSFLLSQSSALSTVSTDFPLRTDNQFLQWSYLEWKSASMNFRAPIRLADVAFRTVMGAVIPRRDPRLQDVELRDRPQVSTSTLVPSMFSPGFKNSMAGNSRYLPTINHALTISLPRNVQTPSLRRKLVQLSNMETSRLPDHDDRLTEPGTADRLSSVVQSRLWGMMQRTLFDRSSGNRLWRQSTEGEVDVDDDFDDILKTNHDASSELKLDEDDDMLFSDDEDDDLLLGDDNSHSGADWERREIEYDTEDVLLGDDWTDWTGNWRDHSGKILMEHSDDDILKDVGGESSFILLKDDDDDLLDDVERENSLLLLDESENDEMLI